MIPLAVIFDCDGVVVDSEEISFSILEQDLADAGLTLDEAAMQSLFLGETVASLHAKARGLGADLPDDWTHDFYERLYAKLRLGVGLIPGVADVLERLAAAGLRLAIGSNGSDEKMAIMLGQHPTVRDAFGGHLYSGQTLGRPKPAPDLYLHAARQLGVDPAHASVVEDSPAGARAARAAGMRCLGYDPHGNAALAAEGAEIFTDMAQLPGLLGL
jgi:HAD superfamily hydrolase (TIGR01509 family)